MLFSSKTELLGPCVGQSTASFFPQAKSVVMITLIIRYRKIISRILVVFRGARKNYHTLQLQSLYISHFHHISYT